MRARAVVGDCENCGPDPGLETSLDLGLHPTCTLADAIRAELAARNITTEEIAARANIKSRTLYDHLAGLHPIPPSEATALRHALEELGPFMFSAARRMLVIRGGHANSGSPQLGADVPLLRVRVDTVWVTLDPHPDERTALRATIAKLFREKAKYRDSARHQRGGVTAWSYGGDWERIKLQLAPWRTADRQTFQTLLRAMYWARDTPFRSFPKLTLSRLDVACDYGIGAEFLLANRPPSRKFKRVVNEDGGMTWMWGARDGHSTASVRLYDGSRRHRHDSLTALGPWTRMEAEFHPSPIVAATTRGIAGMLASMDPYPKFAMALRATRGLSLVDLQLVELARQLGLPYLRKEFAPKDMRRLNAAWKVLAQSESALVTLRALGAPPGPADAKNLKAWWTPWWERIAERAVYLLFHVPVAGDEKDIEGAARASPPDGSMRWDQVPLAPAAWVPSRLVRRRRISLAPRRKFVQLPRVVF